MFNRVNLLFNRVNLLASVLSLLLVCACGDDATSSDATTGSGGSSSSSSSSSSGGSSSVSTVTVGVFERTGDDTYVEVTAVDPLVYQVGVSCQTWDRRVESPGPTDTVQEAHDHFNAADEVVYEGDTLSWVEYGPEHSQSEIDATCATGASGKSKTVNSTDYEFDGNMGEQDANGNWIGFYLKITSVE